jgi:hypothetical protein
MLLALGASILQCQGSKHSWKGPGQRGWGGNWGRAQVEFAYQLLITCPLAREKLLVAYPPVYLLLVQSEEQLLVQGGC